MAAVVEACEEPGFKEADRTPGRYYYMETFSTWGAATGAATPLPEGVFDGPRDRRWTANRTTGCMEPVIR